MCANSRHTKPPALAVSANCNTCRLGCTAILGPDQPSTDVPPCPEFTKSPASSS